jgi:stalled ribosome alternative rescue factor ArfA
MALLEQSLFVKKSGIPKAGKGLFTRKEIKRGTRIVEYKGRKVLWVKVKHTDGHNTYLMRVNRTHAIDAKPTLKALGRYANDAKGPSKIKELTNNALYVQEGNCVFIEASKNIPAGSEILVGYGKEFWQLQRQLIRQKKNSGN